MEQASWAIHPSSSVISSFHEICLALACCALCLLVVHVTGARKIDAVGDMVDMLIPMKNFLRSSFRMLKRCTKPSRQEFYKMCVATAIGFGLMGTLGFVVKLIHIPINNIIVS